MLIQVFEKLLRISMIWVDLERLIRHLVALLKLSFLEHKQGYIKARLEEIVSDLARLQVIILRLIDVASAELQDSQIIKRLGMIRVMTH